jgi:hypothetical protein
VCDARRSGAGTGAVGVVGLWKLTRGDWWTTSYETHDIQAAVAQLTGSTPTSKPGAMAAVTDFVTTSSFQVPYGTPRILSILRVFQVPPDLTNAVANVRMGKH